MFKIEDLSIEDDVLPIFNYTNNKISELKILEMLKKPVSDLESIIDRQQILKGFISNWHILETFTYHRLALVEVSHFLENLSNGENQPERGKTMAIIRLSYDKKEKARLYSRYVQLILFFENFHKRYFSQLRLVDFPEAYKVKIRQAAYFINRLELSYYIDIVKENKFSNTHIFEFSKIVNSISKEEISVFIDFFHEFEAYFSICKSIVYHNFCFPSFDNNRFLLNDFYHPSLDNPVKNSLHLTSNRRVVVLTGPNMSGKSTLLKSVSLCILLSHVGLAVPASKCILPFYESISISINSPDNLQNGYSYFMMEIQNVKSIAIEATSDKRCFAVFDELFKGTNIDDAQEISLTTIKGLTQFKNSYFFISTHLLQIEELLADKDKDLVKLFIDCELIEGIPKFNYKLKEGWSQLKIGKILFNLEGLSNLLKL